MSRPHQVSLTHCTRSQHRLPKDQARTTRHWCPETDCQPACPHTQHPTFPDAVSSPAILVPTSHTYWPKHRKLDLCRSGLTASSDAAGVLQWRGPRAYRAECQLGLGGWHWACAQVCETVGAERAFARSEEHPLTSQSQRRLHPCTDAYTERTSTGPRPRTCTIDSDKNGQ